MSALDLKGAELNISVSGGSASFGNINQGDHGQLEANQSVEYRAEDLECFVQSISNIAAHNNINFSDYQALQAEVAELVKSSTDQTGAVGRIKQLGDKYAWAIKPLSILFAALIKNN